MQYKQYSGLNYKNIALVKSVPVLADSKGLLSLEYKNQCVKDISGGYLDGSLWALSCEADAAGNSDVLKWDPFNNVFFVVPGAKGIKISAFNHVGAAVLDA